MCGGVVPASLFLLQVLRQTFLLFAPSCPLPPRVFFLLGPLFSASLLPLRILLIVEWYRNFNEFFRIDRRAVVTYFKLLFLCPPAYSERNFINTPENSQINSQSLLHINLLLNSYLIRVAKILSYWLPRLYHVCTWTGIFSEYFELIWCLPDRASSWKLKNKIQLNATDYFIMIVLGSACFGHHYAHRQELTTIALVTT